MYKWSIGKGVRSTAVFCNLWGIKCAVKPKNRRRKCFCSMGKAGAVIPEQSSAVERRSLPLRRSKGQRGEGRRVNKNHRPLLVAVRRLVLWTFWNTMKKKVCFSLMPLMDQLFLLLEKKTFGLLWRPAKTAGLNGASRLRRIYTSFLCRWWKKEFVSCGQQNEWRKTFENNNFTALPFGADSVCYLVSRAAESCNGEALHRGMFR